MNYPIEGAKKYSKIHKRRGKRETPTAPSYKDNNDRNENHTDICHHPIAFTDSNMRIVQLGAPIIPQSTIHNQIHL